MGVVEGAIIYANLLVLLAIGLTLTYITTAVPNFAQGTFAIFGSYIALTLFRLFKIHPYASIPVAFILGGLLGLATYLFVLRPLIRKEASIVTLMIATLAWDLILLGTIGAYSDYLAKLTRKTSTKFIFTYFWLSTLVFYILVMGRRWLSSNDYACSVYFLCGYIGINR